MGRTIFGKVYYVVNFQIMKNLEKICTKEQTVRNRRSKNKNLMKIKFTNCSVSMPQNGPGSA